MEREFRFLSVGDNFTFEGKEYTKSNHGRAKFKEEGREVFRNFKRRKIVIVKE